MLSYIKILCLTTIACSMLLSGCVSPQQQLQHQARNGIRSAQAMLSEAYLRGYFSSIDYVTAKRWAQQGAYGNQPLALFVMGEIYRHGYGDTTPDYQTAINYYQQALPGLKRMASEGNIHAKYNLGLLYKWGIVVKEDKSRALKYFRSGIQRNFAPAINQFGICYRDGLAIKADQARAKYYFLEAAKDKYPPAQYNLALLYFKQKNIPPALKWLDLAVAAEYPPAMTMLAERQQSTNSSNRQKIISLYRSAALAGYPKAQFKLAELLREQQNLPLAAKWLLKAVDRSYRPAMLTLARLNAPSKPVKSLILFELIKNNSGKVPEKLQTELDRKTGMSLVVNALWHNISQGEFYLKSNSTMARIIRGYKAGIGQGSHDLFMKELKKSPERFYLSCDWQLIIDNQLPIIWAGDIFQYIPARFHNSPAFWLSYATCANRAGNGAIAMYAAHQLSLITEKIKPSPRRKIFLDLAAIIKCTALVILGHENDAYDMLFKQGRLAQTPELINYINHWALPALKDRQKFIAATGLNSSKLASFIKLPIKTDFYDMQNNNSADKTSSIIQPQLKAPVIK